MIDVEDPEFPDAEGWTVVEKANGGIGFKHHGA